MAYPNSRKLPWFMIPYYQTRQDMPGTGGGFSSSIVITTDTIPKEVSDTKQLNYHEQQLPGGYTSIYKYGSAGARKVSFKLEIADFNDDLGLSTKLSQFDLLRRPEISTTRYSSADGSYPDKIERGFKNFFKDQRYAPFYSNPYVIYFNSLYNTIPLPFQVLKCDFVTSNPNRLGRPQYAVIDFELAQLEDHWLSAMEDKIKKLAAAAGGIGQSLPNLIRSLRNGNSRTNVYKNKVSKFGF